jgi:hypothetical protein
MTSLCISYLNGLRWVGAARQGLECGHTLGLGQATDGIQVSSWIEEDWAYICV